MLKAIVALTVVALGFLGLCVGLIQFAAAQPLASIRITPTGDVDPATAPIEHIGDVFRLTDSLYGTSLIVEENNIIVDGQGFTLQGPGMTVQGFAGINLTCTNVTVANFRVWGWQVGVLGVFNNNTVIANNLIGNALDVAVYASDYRIVGNRLGAERIVGNNNVILQNQIVLGTYASGFWITHSSGTIIEANNVTLSKLSTFFISTDNGDFHVYHNNFLNVEENTGGYLLLIMSYPVPTNATSPPWDNGYPSGGNYWSDYSCRYPTAFEVDDSGIGSLQYVSSTTHEVVDRYPLLAPYTLSEPALPTQPVLNNSSNAKTNEHPQPAEQQPTALYAVLTTVVVLVGAFLVVYRARRKPVERRLRENSPSSNNNSGCDSAPRPHFFVHFSVSQEILTEV